MLADVQEIAVEVLLPQVGPFEQQYRDKYPEQWRRSRGASAAAAFKKAMADAKERQKRQGWKEVSMKQGTRITRRKTAGSDVMCIVAVSEIIATPLAVFELLADTSRIAEYNEVSQSARSTIEIR